MQSLPNFARTSTPTQGRLLRQVWPRQPDPLTMGYPKLQNHWRKNFALQKMHSFSRAVPCPGWLVYIVIEISSHLKFENFLLQFIGEPMNCYVEGVPEDVMNTYCWIQSTFTIPSRLRGIEGKDVPHPGISPLADLKVKNQMNNFYAWHKRLNFRMEKK